MVKFPFASTLGVRKGLDKASPWESSPAGPESSFSLLPGLLWPHRSKPTLPGTGLHRLCRWLGMTRIWAPPRGFETAPSSSFCLAPQDHRSQLTFIAKLIETNLKGLQENTESFFFLNGQRLMKCHPPRNQTLKNTVEQASIRT